jgi:glutathione S-transferase
MLTLHHLNNSRSHRILWLLEELGLEYDLVFYQRDPKTMLAPPELKNVHPLGKAPVLTDGDLTVAESGAIIEYLLDKHDDGTLRPAAGAPERVPYLTFMHFAEGSAMPPLLLKLYFSRMGDAAAAVLPRIDGQITEILTFLDGELENRDFFAGDDFTAADIQMSFPLEAAVARGGLDHRFQNLTSFLQRIHERPAYQRAVKRGGAMMAAR